MNIKSSITLGPGSGSFKPFCTYNLGTSYKQGAIAWPTWPQKAIIAFTITLPTHPMIVKLCKSVSKYQQIKIFCSCNLGSFSHLGCYICQNLTRNIIITFMLQLPYPYNDHNKCAIRLSYPADDHKIFASCFVSFRPLKCFLALF